MAIFEELPDFETMDISGLKNYFRTPVREKMQSAQIRSALMVRADTPKHLNKLDVMKPDVAVINLEDGIAPEKKEWSAYLAGAFLSNLKKSHSLITVRVNPLKQGGDEEIGFFNQFKPDAIRIPKIKTPKEVEEALYLTDTAIDLHLTIETKEAFQAMKELKIDDRVKVFHFGILDLLTDMNQPQSMVKLDNPLVDYLRVRFLAEASLAGVTPMGFIYQDFKNLEVFRRWCEKDKALGFSGKGCISPGQVEVANEVFGVNKKDLERAEYIKQIFEGKAREGVTGFSDETYGFIDEPIYRDALLVLQKQQR